MNPEWPLIAQCPHCEKTYGTKQRLNDHIVLEHENSAKFECDICHRKHPTISKLKAGDYTNKLKNPVS